MLSGGAGAWAQGSKVDKMMMVFDMYDADKSGSISRKEVSAFVHSMFRGALVYVDGLCAELDAIIDRTRTDDFSCGALKGGEAKTADAFDAEQVRVEPLCRRVKALAIHILLNEGLCVSLIATVIFIDIFSPF